MVDLDTNDKLEERLLKPLDAVHFNCVIGKHVISGTIGLCRADKDVNHVDKVVTGDLTISHSDTDNLHKFVAEYFQCILDSLKSSANIKDAMYKLKSMIELY